MLSPEVRAQTFTITGNTEYARSGQQATLLLDGRVLVAFFHLAITLRP
jgi:hypothetical protein